MQDVGEIEPFFVKINAVTRLSRFTWEDFGSIGQQGEIVTHKFVAYLFRRAPCVGVGFVLGSDQDV